MNTEGQRLETHNLELTKVNGRVNWLSGHVLHRRLKDGLPATEKSARYLVHGYSLIIKDVAAEDAGNYTILLGTKQSDVNKSLTATLIVNGEFTVILSPGSAGGKSMKICKPEVSMTASKKTQIQIITLKTTSICDMAFCNYHHAVSTTMESGF